MFSGYFTPLTPEFVRRIADRRGGIGADGVIRAVRSGAAAWDSTTGTGALSFGFVEVTGRETGGGPPLHLVEVADYVTSGDPRLSAFRAKVGEIVLRVTPIGGYAVPLGLTPDIKKV